MRIEQNDRINRPPAEVFAALTDMGAFTHWNPSAESAQVLTPGPLGLGSRMLVGVKGFGDMEFMVTAFEPQCTLTVAAETKRMAVRHTYLLRPEDGGTRLTQEADMRLKGLFQLMAPVMNALGARGARKTTAGLIRYVESRSVTEP